MNQSKYDDQLKVFYFESGRLSNTSIITSMDAYERIHPFFNFGIFTNQRERFLALLLNEDNCFVGLIQFSSLNKPYIVVNIQKLKDEAVNYSAVKVVIARSSITNNTESDTQDDALVKLLIEECKTINLELFDYLIISAYGNYFSYADKNKLV